MNKQNIAIGILAILVLAVGCKVYLGGGSLGSSANGGNSTNFSAVDVSDGYYINASSVLSSSATTINGVKTTYKRSASLNQATTTVCALQSPTDATTTLQGGGLDLTVSSTTASTVTIAKASTAFATTTLINSVSYSANAQGAAIAASTTLSALEQTNRTFAPGTYLVFGMQGGTGTFSPTGVCSATFQSLD